MSENNQAPAAPVEQQAPVQESQELESQEQDLEASESEQSQEEVKAEEQKAQEIKKQLKKLKLKVDGEELEEEFDPDDEEYMRKQLQLAKVAQKRMAHSSQLEKEIRHFVDELRKNPRRVLSDPKLGIDLKKIAAEMIEEEIENSRKSPEQLEKEKLQNELKAIKEEREREKEELKQKELARLQEIEFQRYETSIQKALEKSDLPTSPYVVKKMADYMLLGLQNNIELSPDEILPIVKDEIQNDIKSMFSVMPDEVIESMVGKDVFNRIRKKNVNKAKEIKAPQALKNIAKDVASKGKTDKKEEKKSFKDFFGV